MSANSAGKKLALRVAIYFVCGAALVIYIKLCEIGLGFPCLFNELWGIICPSCGATRAAFSIMSGDFYGAVGYNPVFTLAIYPIGAIIILQDFCVAIFRVLRKKDAHSVYSIIEFIFGGGEL